MDTKICILCLTNCKDPQSLFDTKVGSDSLTEVLRLHFWQLNEHINIMCTSCLGKITSFHEFYIEVRNVHSKLREQQSVGNVNDVKYELNIKKECEIPTNEPDHDPQPINDDLFEYDTESKFAVDDVADKSDEGGSGNVSEEKDVPIKKKPKRNKKSKIKSKKKPKRSNSDNESDDNTPPAKLTDVKLENGKDILEKNYDRLLRRFSMQCELCSGSFTSLDDARKHYRAYHGRNGYLMCCERRFPDYGRIVDHLEWHDNPEKFTCATCNKTFIDGTCLRRHKKDIHGLENGRTYKCDQCEMTFPRRNPYAYHMKSIHPEDVNKLECNQCKKKFTIEASLRAHIRKVHENANSRICDICAKFFKCSQSYELHYKVVHTNSMQKVQCDLCGAWLKHTGILKEHMNRQHKRQNVPQICKYCSKTTANRKALMNHIRCHHSNISYTCHICDKSFKQTLTLKEHMAIHSGDKELYTCSFCPKTFRSRANMYAHRKRAHPIEYQQSKLIGLGVIEVKQDDSVSI